MNLVLCNVSYTGYILHSFLYNKMGENLMDTRYLLALQCLMVILITNDCF